MPTTILVLGAYGEFVGSIMAKEALKRPNVIVKILVRPGYEKSAEKKAKVDDLVSLGAITVDGDASNQDSLNVAFAGVDIVVSCLGGWGDLLDAHKKVYSAALLNKVKRIVPAQFGFDVLSFPEDAMDDYFKMKKAWNVAGIESKVPYTIISQGAFAQWTLGNHCFFIKHDTQTVLYVGDPDNKGWITTSMEDTARITIDAVLDPSQENSRIAIAGAMLSARDIASTLSKVTKKEYKLQEFKSLEQVEKDLKDKSISAQDAFNNSLFANFAKGTFRMGFQPPFLIDIPAKYGWVPENFEQLVTRLVLKAEK